MANTAPYDYKPPELVIGMYVTSRNTDAVYEVVWVYNNPFWKKVLDCKDLRTGKVDQFSIRDVRPFHIQKGNLYGLETLHNYKIIIVMQMEFRKATGLTVKCVIGETMTELLTNSKAKKRQNSFSIAMMEQLPIIDETYATSV